MSTATAIETKKTGKGGLAPKEEDLSQKISWEDFENEYLCREDEFTYEWLDGYVQKTERTMNKYQLYILKNLQDFFLTLLVAQKITGNLMAEADLFFQKKHRRPDICWLSPAQVASLAKGNNDVPAFVIEIISSSDTQEKMSDKMNDYRAAGVQTVWHILPNAKEIHVYKGEKLKEMNVFTDDEICSAAPALPDFEMTVNEVFKK